MCGTACCGNGSSSLGEAARASERAPFPHFQLTPTPTIMRNAQCSGLTILPHAVVFGMHKAFDFDATALPTSAAGRRVIAALATGPLHVHLVKKRNGEMARVFYSAPDSAWLFGQKNRSILAADASELALLAAAQMGEDRPATAHAVEVGQIFFRMLEALLPAAAAAVRDYCTTHVLALEKVGSAFQQHLARETVEGAPPELAVFGVCPLDGVGAALAAGCLPRLPVEAMVADMERLGLPWAGGLPPSRLLQAPAAAALPPHLAAALREAASCGGACPPIIATSVGDLEHLRLAVLSLDDDNLEGVVPVLQAPSGAVLALFKFKVAIYYVRRRLREQIKSRISPPQLPALRMRLEEWISKVPPHRAAHYRRVATRVHHYAMCTGMDCSELERRILTILELCSVGVAPMDCFQGCGICDPQRAVQAAAIITLPGGVPSVAAALAAAHPGVLVVAHEKQAVLKAEALCAWSRDAAGLLIAEVRCIMPPLALLDGAVGLQRLVLLRPAAASAPQPPPELLAACHATNARAAAAIFARALAAMDELASAAAAAAVAGAPGAVCVVVEDANAAAAAAVAHGARHRGVGASGDLATSAAAPGSSATRLVVFLVGVVGLGKSTLARALCEWVKAAPPQSVGAPPWTASELDQDRFGVGSSDAARAAVRAALLAALHAQLDAGVDLLIVHRNGPGSAPLLEVCRSRGVPWVCVFPSELLSGAPAPHAVLGTAAALLAREDAAAPGFSALGGSERVALLRNFFTALPSAAASIVGLAGSAALPLAYFEEAAAPSGDDECAARRAAEAAALRWLLAAAGLRGFECAAPVVGDAGLAAAATMQHGVRHRPLASLCTELGPRLLKLAALPDAARCGLGSCEDAVAQEDAYVGVFLSRSEASAPLFASAHGRDLHITLAHRDTAPAQLASLVAAGVLGARVAVSVSHRFTAHWEAGAAAAPASVTALVVDGLLTLAEGGREGENLLARVASHAPHVTLLAEGAAANVAAGAALRLLLAHAGGALPSVAATMEVAGVRFAVAPEPLQLVGVVATFGD